jgi:ribonuclease P protein component
MFTTYFKSGRRIQSPVATLIVSPHQQFHGAVVVSKKVHKSAVKRNRLRRRAYAQLYQALNNHQTGVFILVLKPKLIELTRTEQHQALADLIAQV